MHRDERPIAGVFRGVHDPVRLGLGEDPLREGVFNLRKHHGRPDVEGEVTHPVGEGEEAL
jgi:hypothetical protein